MAVAVILDMDGVILDTEPLAQIAWRDAASGCGYDLGDQLYERMIGLSASSTRLFLAEHFGNEFPMVRVEASAWDCYRGLIETHGVRQKPGLTEFLQFLDDRALPRAVATSTATDLARELLQRAGVLERIGPVVGGDQVRRGKPDPDIFLAAAATLNHLPADCIVLEDSSPGIRAARAAGMKAILIPDGRAPSDETRRLAYAVADSLLEAGKLVDQLVIGDC